MIEPFILSISVLLIFSVLASKAGSRFGVPLLVLFMGIGMFAGAEGPGALQFHNLAFTQTLAVISLCFILFSGGLTTSLKEIRPIIKSGLILSTIGVLIATALVGWFAVAFLHFSKIAGLLLGATVASTDVAAVFTVLRSRNISLAGNLKPLLEFESAVNDPMTVFLSVGLLQIYTTDHDGSLLALFPLFIKQMILGSLFGWLGGHLGTFLINRLKLEFEGLYPVLSIGLVLLIYSATQLVGGSGFLAVYLAGIFLGNRGLLHKKSLVQFHDGIAWLMQIAMFLAMGLLVLPSELSQIALPGMALSAFLIFVARPASVHLCLLPFRFSYPEVLMISWAGLRGAVPIILATYPLIAGIPEAKMIFNLVFFVVLTSILFQGAGIASISKWLGVNSPFKASVSFPIEFNPTKNLKNEMVEIPVPAISAIVGKSVLELGLPSNILIVLIHRKGDVIVPRGSTIIEADDRLLVLAEKSSVDFIEKLASSRL